MGNHDVGRGMSAAARAFWIANGDAPVSKEKALAALDTAGEDYIGADAEFDDELSMETPLSRLVCIAFDAPPEDIELLRNGTGNDEDWDRWYDGTYARFREHFRFC